MTLRDRQRSLGIHPMGPAGSRVEGWQQGHFSLRTDDAKPTLRVSASDWNFLLPCWRRNGGSKNMMAGSTLHLIYDRLVSRSAFICPAFYSTSKHGGRILFYGVQRIATSRNFPPCSFQITSPSLLPVPQVMRNWMGFGLENSHCNICSSFCKWGHLDLTTGWCQHQGTEVPFLWPFIHYSLIYHAAIIFILSF